MPAIEIEAWPPAAQVNTWYQAYCETRSKSNEAIFERASLLRDIEEVLEDTFESFLRDPEKGFGLTPVEAQRGVDLVFTIKRYPGGDHKSALLWEAMGDQIIRLAALEDPAVRKKVRDRCYREAEELNGFISAAKLTSFIKAVDPTYYEARPSTRKLIKDKLVKANVQKQKDLNSCTFGIRKALKHLIDEEGYDPETAQSFFTKASVKIAKI